MKTRIRIDRKTGKVTSDVLDGVGQQCRENNRHLYDALAQRFRLTDDRFHEEAKPEMDLVETQAETESQKQTDG